MSWYPTVGALVVLEGKDRKGSLRFKITRINVNGLHDCERVDGPAAGTPCKIAWDAMQPADNGRFSDTLVVEPKGGTK